MSIETVRGTGRMAMMAALVLPLLAGCSDNSRMNFYIESITGTNTASTGNPYIESDLVGNFGTSACTVIQDQVSLDVAMEQPGTMGIGPSLNAYVTNFVIDYFYFDPADGVQKGPVNFLTQRSNIRQPISMGGGSRGTATFRIPLVTFQVKAWAVGNSCNGMPGFAGQIDRMAARVTLTGEDTLGKKLTAQGSIFVYMYDYGPGPTDPAGAPRTPENWCFGVSIPAYWGVVCPP